MRSLVGGGNSVDATAAIKSVPCYLGGTTSVTIGCGGWAAFVSDYIFGTSGMPARKTTIANVRPGDIIMTVDNNGLERHISIATSNAIRDNDIMATSFDITDSSNINGYKIYWSNTEMQRDTLSATSWHLEVWTRYPA